MLELFELKDVTRFWIKVMINSDNCWEWQSAKNSDGYGVFQLKGKYLFAHRIAWSLFHNKEIPKGKLTCHHCDNPICCNPHHLFLGTSQDNVLDAVKKGRWRRKKT